MPFSIETSVSAVAELKAIKAYERKRITEEIDAQLKDQPTTETRNRKPLPKVEPGFEHVPPLWELRVGEYRVFFDVNEDEKKVIVRAVRKKTPKQTTDEVVQ
jgi:mRNA-degrading endonuclease RelE of RelBE toxin-antitoxin system